MCGCTLMKRVERIENNPVPGNPPHWEWRKDLYAYDYLHPADMYERVVKVWCPDCGLLYSTE